MSRRWATPGNAWSVTVEVMAVTGHPGADSPRVVVRERGFTHRVCATPEQVQAILGPAYAQLEAVTGQQRSTSPTALASTDVSNAPRRETRPDKEAQS